MPSPTIALLLPSCASMVVGGLFFEGADKAMMRIKRIRIGSAAKVVGFLFLIIGLIFGEITVLLSSRLQINLPQLSNEIMGLPSQAALGLAGLVIIPLAYGLFGLLLGALIAVIYNLSAGWLGGLEIEYE